MHLHRKLRMALIVAGIVLSAQASAQVTFFSGEGFRGRQFSASGVVDNFADIGFNDRASSAIVEGGRWQVCQDAHFRGRCVELRPGRYESLASMGMDKLISSVRPIDRDARYDNPPPAYVAAPPPAYVAQGYDYHAGPDERLYQAEVTSVRAVVGPPEQRCWVERQQIVEDRPSGVNVPGAVVGAVVGGILGHQIGGGRGQDIATAGGAVAGAAVGANVGRGGTQVYGQDVQRCTNVSRNDQPDYWDVTYNFRGIEHRVQMTAPPGPTIAVNRNGEPRG